METLDSHAQVDTGWSLMRSTVIIFPWLDYVGDKARECKEFDVNTFGGLDCALTFRNVPRPILLLVLVDGRCVVLEPRSPCLGRCKER